MDFGSSGGRKLVGAFVGGAITSNGGVVLLSSAGKTIGLCDRLVGGFRDHRNADLVTHESVDLLRQRIFALGLGYEDLIDHDVLRFDPALMAVLDRREDALAGNSTLNRLEHASKIGHDRNHNLDRHPSAIERLFVDVFMEAQEEPPIRIVVRVPAGRCSCWRSDDYATDRLTHQPSPSFNHRGSKNEAAEVARKVETIDHVSISSIAPLFIAAPAIAPSGQLRE